MKLTKNLLEQYIKEVMKESWRSGYRKSAARQKEMNYGVERERNYPRQSNEQNWEKFIQPALEELVSADPDNLLADELANMPIRKIHPHEYEQILADLQKHGVYSLGFKMNAKAFHMAE